MAERAPRVLWLNGPPFVGKRTLAAQVRDRLDVAALDAEAVGFTLLRGLPATMGAGSLQDLWLWQLVIWRLGVDMARAFGMVVVAAGLHNADRVADLLEAFRQAGVDVLHVVLAADDAAMRARIHGHDVDDHAKRWALEHLQHANAALVDVRESIRLDATGRAPDQLVGHLAHVLARHGWLERNVPGPPQAGRPEG